MSCKDYEGDYYYDHYDYVDYDYYYHDNDDSACQGYRYDFDLIIGIKPTNSSTSDVPFTYCTQSRVVPSLGNKIVDQWMEEVRTFAAASQRIKSAILTHRYCSKNCWKWKTLTITASTFQLLGLFQLRPMQTFFMGLTNMIRASIATSVICSSWVF